MPKRERDNQPLQARIDAILENPQEDAGMKLCTASLEWDDGDVRDDYFAIMRPFVETLDKDSMEAQLFFESERKDDETILEEARFLVRSNVIDEEDEAAMKAAAPADRKRMLLVHLLIDADEEEYVEGEEGEDDEIEDDESEDDESEDDESEDDEIGGEEEGEGGVAIVVWKAVLVDESGGKYKICDRSSDHKVSGAGEYVQGLRACIGQPELGQGDALVVSWGGTVGFRVGLGAGKCSCSGIFGGELSLDLSGVAPKIPMAKEDFGSDLYAACRTAVQLKLNLGGHWTDDAAKAALAPLFD
eukprot:CAMPEP_0119365890 /NCGR_PEP_ID=MMETSP1334-20130426/12792_1 /TAXON_ID=127549 /ORGANISM="Calcidiscus leptoporus, Strain RCC1130" /LENGTH=301 /DNA_ID=CAMNT_0007381967 /DNA_START=46 /DNA_END=951 /DNA_ORIENTATION=+